MSWGTLQEDIERLTIKVMGIFNTLAPSRTNLAGISSRPVLLEGLSFKA